MTFDQWFEVQPHPAMSDEEIASMRADYLRVWTAAQAALPEATLTMPRTDEIKLACGEMTAHELRTVKAVLGWFIRRNEPTPQE